MRWLLDERVDFALVEWLRQAGHDVAYVPDLSPQASDIEVMHLAATDARLLLTEDKDFGDLVFRHALPVPGVLLLRIDASRHEQKPARLAAATDLFGDRLLGQYTVIEDARFRARPLRTL
jgi:predicted nuclease of predicted toxin-antitoxin system